MTVELEEEAIKMIVILIYAHLGEDNELGEIAINLLKIFENHEIDLGDL